MYLSPHRVPDRNHPRQHRLRSAEFPSTETLVIITVYYRSCHDIVLYSSVSLIGELQKSPWECTAMRNSGAVCRCVQNVTAGLFGYEPLPNWQLPFVSHRPDSHATFKNISDMFVCVVVLIKLRELNSSEAFLHTGPSLVEFKLRRWSACV